MNDQTIIAEIEAQEARRAAATVARDFDTIESLIGDDLLYVHSSATVEDRNLYMERLRNACAECLAQYFVFDTGQPIMDAFACLQDGSRT